MILALRLFKKKRVGLGSVLSQLYFRTKKGYSLDMPVGPSKLARRNARLELYVRRVCDAWDANQVSGVTDELNRVFAEEEKHCPSIESRCKYINYGLDTVV